MKLIRRMDEDYKLHKHIIILQIEESDTTSTCFNIEMFFHRSSNEQQQENVSY